MSNDFMEVDELDGENTKKTTSKKTQQSKKQEDNQVNEKFDTPSQKKSNVNEYRYNIIDLPSNGKLEYNSSIEYRDMLFSEEKQLSTATEDTYIRTLNNVLKSVANDLSYFEELSIHDRDYFLMWIWANNYGVFRTIQINCPSCGQRDNKTIDLRELDVIPLSDEYVEPFTFTTKMGHEVSLRALRVKDELRAEKYIRKKMEDGVSSEKIDNIVNLMLTFSVDIGKAVDIENKIKWVENNLTTKDMAIIRQFHEYFEFGVNDVVTHECSSCAREVTGKVPFFPTGNDEQAVQDDFRTILQANQRDETSAERD